MVTVPPDFPISREAFELLREAYSETEAWKVAQLAAPLLGTRTFNLPIAQKAAIREAVETAREVLAEARRQVAADPARLP